MAINTSKYHVWGYKIYKNPKLSAESQGIPLVLTPHVEKSLSIQDLGTGLTLSMLPDQAIEKPRGGQLFHVDLLLVSCSCSNIFQK